MSLDGEPSRPPAATLFRDDDTSQVRNPLAELTPAELQQLRGVVDCWRPEFATSLERLDLAHCCITLTEPISLDAPTRCLCAQPLEQPGANLDPHLALALSDPHEDVRRAAILAAGQNQRHSLGARCWLWCRAGLRPKKSRRGPGWALDQNAEYGWRDEGALKACRKCS